ncbi:HIT domain-containing protein [Candidatus Babeliales bacterium]|nr:HIT domain-containing protein [Candidatus Babeliales bacterium]
MPVQVRLPAPFLAEAEDGKTVQVDSPFICKELEMNNNCIFCKIINKEIPAQVIAETETIIVIKDIAPETSIHYLIIPKKHFIDITHLTENDRDYAADILFMAKQLSDADLQARSFKLINNNGAAVGQTVFHIHVHFCAGKKLSL